MIDKQINEWVDVDWIKQGIASKRKLFLSSLAHTSQVPTVHHVNDDRPGTLRSARRVQHVSETDRSRIELKKALRSPLKHEDPVSMPVWSVFVSCAW